MGFFFLFSQSTQVLVLKNNAKLVISVVRNNPLQHQFLYCLCQILTLTI